jgi:hypothetical protein
MWLKVEYRYSFMQLLLFAKKYFIDVLGVSIWLLSDKVCEKKICLGDLH